jgi:hypothetical protein
LKKELGYSLVVQHLPCTFKVLGFIPAPQERKERRKRERVKEKKKKDNH